MTLLQEMRARREEILAAAKRNGIASVRVFGSVAREEERPDSDIDLLIDLERPVVQGLAFLDFKNEVEAIFHRPVHILFEKGTFPPVLEALQSELQPL
jgi:uncharacterized protein